jgi:hypothetical protein
VQGATAYVNITGIKGSTRNAEGSICEHMNKIATKEVWRSNSMCEHTTGEEEISLGAGRESNLYVSMAERTECKDFWRERRYMCLWQAERNIATRSVETVYVEA